MKSFLSQFQNMRETLGKDLAMPGDTLLVERIHSIDHKRTTKSGLTVVHDKYSPNRQAQLLMEDVPTFVRVIAVGEGYFDDETKEDMPVETRPGAILLLPKQSVQWFGEFGEMEVSGDTYGQIGITKESELRMRFVDESAYEKAFKIINDNL